MKRIVLHWTGGGPRPSPYEKSRYHFLIDQYGERHEGDMPPEANKSPLGAGYVRHAGGFNSDSIGISLCGMLNATESPFSPGPYPITAEQVREAAKLAAELCVIYGIPVMPQTVLMHSEVLPRFGRGIYKWDVNFWGGLAKPMSATDAGDYFRGMVTRELDKIRPLQAPARPWWHRFLHRRAEVDDGTSVTFDILRPMF